MPNSIVVPAQDRRFRDIVGGGLLLGLGLFMALYSPVRYGLGTFATMRPGMFPTLIGVLLIGLGVLIVIPAIIGLRRGGRQSSEKMEPWEWRPFLVVVGSLSAFALTVPVLGMVPAIFALIGIAALGSTRLGVLPALVLSCLLSLLMVAIFNYGLGLGIPIAQWPLL